MRYNNPDSPLDNFRNFLYRGGVPVTTTLLLINAVTFLAAFMSVSVLAFLGEWVAASYPAQILLRPWTILTYPLAYLAVSDQGFFNFLFGGFMFWSAGGSLERSWGSTRYGVFFFVMAVISAISLLLGCFILHDSYPLFGFFLPMACCVIAFCTLNTEQSIMFFFFPMPAKYFAIIVTLYTWVYVGQNGHATLGLFALVGLLASYLYVRFGRSWGDIGSYNARPRRGPDLRMSDQPKRPTFRTTLDGSPRQRSFFDFSGRLKDWRERRRLEKLWRNSGLPGSESEWRDDERRRR